MRDWRLHQMWNDMKLIWHEGLDVTFTTDHGIFRALCFSSYHCFVDNVAQKGRAGCKKWKQQQINMIRYCAIYIWTSKRAFRPWVTLYVLWLGALKSCYYDIIWFQRATLIPNHVDVRPLEIFRIRVLHWGNTHSTFQYTQLMKYVMFVSDNWEHLVYKWRQNMKTTNLVDHNWMIKCYYCWFGDMFTFSRRPEGPNNIQGKDQSEVDTRNGTIFQWNNS